MKRFSRLEVKGHSETRCSFAAEESVPFRRCVVEPHLFLVMIRLSYSVSFCVFDVYFLLVVVSTSAENCLQRLFSNNDLLCIKRHVTLNIVYTVCLSVSLSFVLLITVTDY